MIKSVRRWKEEKRMLDRLRLTPVIRTVASLLFFHLQSRERRKRRERLAERSVCMEGAEGGNEREGVAVSRAGRHFAFLPLASSLLRWPRRPSLPSSVCGSSILFPPPLASCIHFISLNFIHHAVSTYLSRSVLLLSQDIITPSFCRRMK